MEDIPFRGSGGMRMIEEEAKTYTEAISKVLYAVIILATVHVVIMGDLHVLWYTIDEIEVCKGCFCSTVLGCLTSVCMCGPHSQSRQIT